MAGGWARDGAVQEQIDASVEDAVKRARSELNARGPGRSHCEECEEPIPEARRKAVAGVKMCINCQEAEDAENKRMGGINRRGSKDSQLR
ncbi:MAG: DksA/TraR family C4-type zinc finger protein [Gammaproteobacteria bacterium]